MKIKIFCLGLFLCLFFISCRSNEEEIFVSNLSDAKTPPEDNPALKKCKALKGTLISKDIGNNETKHFCHFSDGTVKDIYAL